MKVSDIVKEGNKVDITKIEQLIEENDDFRGNYKVAYEWSYSTIFHCEGKTFYTATEFEEKIAEYKIKEFKHELGKLPNWLKRMINKRITFKI